MSPENYFSQARSPPLKWLVGMKAGGVTTGRRLGCLGSYLKLSIAREASMDDCFVSTAPPSLKWGSQQIFPYGGYEISWNSMHIHGRSCFRVGPWPSQSLCSPLPVSQLLFQKSYFCWSLENSLHFQISPTGCFSLLSGRRGRLPAIFTVGFRLIYSLYKSSRDNCLIMISCHHQLGYQPMFFWAWVLSKTVGHPLFRPVYTWVLLACPSYRCSSTGLLPGL
jgi:hypothetical protein